ncbi:hypothetical protein HHL16_10335 [Pseudoflavitalea sp. G-6-1-2]|uniref:hypothetical protein n=1 Tax=Pseudoflavitalea sp. G-6-1-2 TaxID=2728841 RepID=UPI00146B11D3|nr:hypothetical protein [Pseudoflavitalea sp. G-6-1-2]NML21272.1 hypothetical protein [Pseudoflavitalea sp. G-6-1-2]
MLDFNREKDGTFVPGAPAIGIPVPTQDFFLATSQAGSKQFRPFFGGNYVVFDKRFTNQTTNQSFGLTIGGGWAAQFGARLNFTEGGSVTEKWTNNNRYLANAEIDYNQIDIDQEVNWFKGSGDLTAVDKEYWQRNFEENTLKVGLQREGKKLYAQPIVKYRDNNDPTREAQSNSVDFRKSIREKRTNILSYLNASEATTFGLEKKINGQSRVDDSFRKSHHISEMTVTDTEGKRMVYGIPVYNTTQREATFSVASPSASVAEKARRTGMINYGATDNTLSNSQGRDNMFSRETIPPYATSWLLTGILSPDYIDRTNNGITDDDFGTAIKFDYKQTATKDNPYQWRAPYAANSAHYNEGFQSDPKDDKASYTYGKKELWYLDSITSTKMVAFFYTSERKDGMGVKDENGGMSTTVRPHKLDSICVFTKAEMEKDKPNRVPVKSVYFEYDYSTSPNMPNNSGECVGKNGNPAADCNVNDAEGKGNINLLKGKLTLRKVYFTFGKNKRGKSNPYVFHYDNRPLSAMNISGLPAIPQNDDDAKDEYGERQADRWGTLKKSFYNRQRSNGTTRILNNAEFPYTLQPDEQAGYDVKQLNDWFASHWQLNKIETPTGSIIDIEYEADDYSHVQNRRAMNLFSIVGIKQGNGTIVSGVDVASGLVHAKGVIVELPKAVATIEEFRDNYLTGADGQVLDKIYYKVHTDLNNRSKFENVQGHASIETDLNKFEKISGTRIMIPLTEVKGYNPIAYASWQMLKTDLPQFAYDGYDNSDADGFGKSVEALVRSIVAAVGSARELVQSFEKKAANKGFADKIKLSKSFIRLYCHPLLAKTGGGARVRLIKMSDEWDKMAGGEKLVTGLLYDYTVKQGDKQVSSGVASYEPQIGNDENPFREPVPYVEKVHWGTDKYHFIEKPFGESFFPAPQVGYSQVTVMTVDHYWLQSGGENKKHTGSVVNEFYTARDFPTIVDNLPLDNQNYENSMILRLFTCTAINRVANSQGFKVELNDMHGKPKSVSVLNQGGDKISSTEYFYKVKDQNAATKELDNNVQVLQPDGTIENLNIGMDMDHATDLRASSSESIGIGIGTYGGFFPAWLIPVWFQGLSITPSISIDSYNAVSTVKVIHKYGIVEKVRTMKNGSVIEAKNLVWDGESGNVVMTSSQNEFNDNIYTFSYPAHMVDGNEGMGGAYRTIGARKRIMDPSNPGTKITHTGLQTGDEVANEQLSTKGWVVKADKELWLKDEQGNQPATTPFNTIKVIRSGFRNLTGAVAGTVVMLKDPRVTINGVTRIEINASNKVLDASTTKYKDVWQMPLPYRPDTKKEFNPDFYEVCLPQLIYGLIITCPNPQAPVVKRAISYSSSQAYDANTLLSEGNDDTDTKPECNTNVPAKFGESGTSPKYYMNNPRQIGSGYEIYANDFAMVGKFKIVFDYVSGEFNNLIKSPLSSAAMESKLFNRTANEGRYFVVPHHNWMARVNFDIHPDDYSNTIDFIYVPNKPNPTVSEMRLLMSFHIEGDEIIRTVPICRSGNEYPMNPYYEGIFGNWRQDTAFHYAIDRSQEKGLADQNGGTDIRKSGSFKDFTPFWTFNQINKIVPNPNVKIAGTTSSTGWLWDSRNIFFDRRGNQIETAIPRVVKNQSWGTQIPDMIFSSALYGFNDSYPVAIAANARRNEIAFDSFEDYQQYKQEGSTACPVYRHLDFGYTKNADNSICLGSSCITNAVAHSGKYSVLLNELKIQQKDPGLIVPKEPYVQSINSNWFATDNELALGFRPVYGKEYVLSFWVYDGDPNPKISSMTVRTETGLKSFEGQIFPMVEGWKRVEIPLYGSYKINLSINKTEWSTVYIDDLRIMPKEAKMNTYVYDNNNYRLMAQLDENNFATFFEYDAEGTPIRVKKETERGIMLIKETRQFMKKRTP